MRKVYSTILPNKTQAICLCLCCTVNVFDVRTAHDIGTRCKHTNPLILLRLYAATATVGKGNTRLTDRLCTFRCMWNVQLCIHFEIDNELHGHRHAN